MLIAGSRIPLWVLCQDADSELLSSAHSWNLNRKLSGTPHVGDCSFCRILNLPLWKESQKPYTQATTFSVWKKQTLWGMEKQELVILSRKQIVINTCISTQKHFILHILEKAWQIWTLVRHKLKKAKRLSMISHTYANTHNVLKTLYFTSA